jgi:small subunit ribosomal protein S2
MSSYLYGERNGIHIIDLEQTVPLLHRAIGFVREVVSGGGRVLFVGTKRQASDKVAEAAKRCGQYYVNHRWLGGMLTNWKTISHSIKRLRDFEGRLSEENVGLTKKELLNLTRDRDKLDRALGGIKEMGGLPDVLFVIDTNKEHIAISEAQKLGIPVVAVLDSNSDPSGITYPVPGNDDAIRAISLYCDLVADAVLDGLAAGQAASGVDLGAASLIPALLLAGAALSLPRRPERSLRTVLERLVLSLLPTAVALIHLLPRQAPDPSVGFVYNTLPERGRTLDPQPDRVVFGDPYPFPELTASRPLLTALGVALLVAVIFSWRAARARPEAALATALVLVSVAWPLAWTMHGYAVWPHIVIPLGAALALTLRAAHAAHRSSSATPASSSAPAASR